MVKFSVLSALLLVAGCSGFVVKIDRHLIKSGSSSSDHSLKTDDVTDADDYLSDRQLPGLLTMLGSGLLGLMLPGLLQGISNSSNPLGGLLTGGLGQLGGLLGGRFPMIDNLDQGFGYIPLSNIPQNLQPYTVNVRGIGEAVLLATPEQMQQANSGPYQVYLKPSEQENNKPGEKFLSFHKDKPHITILPIAVPVPEHVHIPHIPTHVSVSGHGGHHGHHGHHRTEEDLEPSEKQNEEASESHGEESSEETS